MVPVDLSRGKIDGYPVRQVSWLRICAGIFFEEHRLLIETAQSYAYHDLAVAMMIVAELSELLARNEEGRLAVRKPFFRFRQFEGGFTHLVERIGHRRTNSLRIRGYSLCSAVRTRFWRVAGVSSGMIGT